MGNGSGGYGSQGGGGDWGGGNQSGGGTTGSGGGYNSWNTSAPNPAATNYNTPTAAASTSSPSSTPPADYSGGNIYTGQGFQNQDMSTQAAKDSDYYGGGAGQWDAYAGQNAKNQQFGAGGGAEGYEDQNGKWVGYYNQGNYGLPTNGIYGQQGQQQPQAQAQQQQPSYQTTQFYQPSYQTTSQQYPQANVTAPPPGQPGSPGYIPTKNGVVQPGPGI